MSAHPLIGKFLMWGDDDDFCGCGTIKAVFPDGTFYVQENEPAGYCIISPHNPRFSDFRVYKDHDEFRALWDRHDRKPALKVVPMKKE